MTTRIPQLLYTLVQSNISLKMIPDKSHITHLLLVTCRLTHCLEEDL